jgi:hypothetical protein
MSHASCLEVSAFTADPSSLCRDIMEMGPIFTLEQPLAMPVGKRRQTANAARKQAAIAGGIVDDDGASHSMCTAYAARAHLHEVGQLELQHAPRLRSVLAGWCGRRCRRHAPFALLIACTCANDGMHAREAGRLWGSDPLCAPTLWVALDRGG